MWTDEQAYQRAADIADKLLQQGVPVVKFSGAHETIMMVFQLHAEAAKYAARLHMAKATPEAFRDLYEAVQ